MSNVIEMPQNDSLGAAVVPLRSPRVRTTADCRRLLSDLRMRPITQRIFLRKFLQRAVANGVRTSFPFPISAVVTP